MGSDDRLSLDRDFTLPEKVSTIKHKKRDGYLPREAARHGAAFIIKAREHLQELYARCFLKNTHSGGLGTIIAFGRSGVFGTGSRSACTGTGNYYCPFALTDNASFGLRVDPNIGGLANASNI